MEELIRGYYDKRAEEEWQRSDRHPMEFAVSRRLLAEYLPRTGDVLDCGGGPGRYAIWLASRGYNVTLFDLSEGCLEWAENQANMQGVSMAYEHGTATDLSRFSDGSFDAVLLMGPLYHMSALADRQRALAEAARVLMPGGLLAVAFLTRTAPLRFIAKEEPGRILDLYQPMLNVVRQGFDESFPPHDADHFHAYFSHPDDVEPLLRTAGLELSGLYATEGFVSMIDAEMNTLEGAEWDAWVDLNFMLASEETLFSGAEHLLALARKL